jgi:hypothetical protein
MMAVYAATGSDAEDGADLASNPAMCHGGRLLARLAELPEASGLARSRAQQNIFWSHNDSGEPILHAFTGEGTAAGRVRVQGAAVVDWEAVETSPCGQGLCLYVADIGDNEQERQRVTIYRMREPSPNSTEVTAVDIIEAAYPEGPQDAEAAFIVRGTLYVVTKGESTPIRLYRVPELQPGAVQTLQLVAELTPTGARKRTRITDAAVSPKGDWVALRTNVQVLFYRTAELLRGQPGMPLAYDVTRLKEPQGEGLAWATDETLLLAGEAKGGGTLAELSCTLPG